MIWGFGKRVETRQTGSLASLVSIISLVLFAQTTSMSEAGQLRPLKEIESIDLGNRMEETVKKLLDQTEAIKKILKGADSPTMCSVEKSEVKAELFDMNCPNTAIVVEGIPTSGDATVGALLVRNAPGEAFVPLCSGTLADMRAFISNARARTNATFITAAHCMVKGYDPSAYRVFFQHAGFFSVKSIHPPDLDVRLSTEAPRADIALLILDRPATGFAPTPLRELHDTNDVPTGKQGRVVGFGRTAGSISDAGIKRTGRICLSDCLAPVSAQDSLCWEFNSLGQAPGLDSNSCRGDSGGPLLVTTKHKQKTVTRLAGVISGGYNTQCQAGDMAYNTSIARQNTWLKKTYCVDHPATQCHRSAKLFDDSEILANVDRLEGTKNEHFYPIQFGNSGITASILESTSRLSSHIKTIRGQPIIAPVGSKSCAVHLDELIRKPSVSPKSFEQMISSCRENIVNSINSISSSANDIARSTLTKRPIPEFDPRSTLELLKPQSVCRGLESRKRFFTTWDGAARCSSIAARIESVELAARYNSIDDILEKLSNEPISENYRYILFRNFTSRTKNKIHKLKKYYSQIILILTYRDLLNHLEKIEILIHNINISSESPPNEQIKNVKKFTDEIQKINKEIDFLTSQNLEIASQLETFSSRTTKQIQSINNIISRSGNIDQPLLRTFLKSAKTLLANLRDELSDYALSESVAANQTVRLIDRVGWRPDRLRIAINGYHDEDVETDIDLYVMEGKSRIKGNNICLNTAHAGLFEYCEIETTENGDYTAVVHSKQGGANYQITVTPIYFFPPNDSNGKNKNTCIGIVDRVDQGALAAMPLVVPFPKYTSPQN